MMPFALAVDKAVPRKMPESLRRLLSKRQERRLRGKARTGRREESLG